MHGAQSTSAPPGVSKGRYTNTYITGTPKKNQARKYRNWRLEGRKINLNIRKCVKEAKGLRVCSGILAVEIKNRYSPLGGRSW